MTSANQGAGGLIKALNTGRFLLQRRAETSSEGGTWGVFGGGSELGEHPERTLVREVMEETGINVDGSPFCPLLVYENPESGHKWHNFLVVVQEEVDPVTNWETEGFGWFTRDNLPEPLHFGVQALMNDEPSIAAIEGGYEGLSYLGEMNHAMYKYRRRKKQRPSIEEQMEQVLREVSTSCGMSISPARVATPKRPLAKYRSDGTEDEELMDESLVKLMEAEM